MAASTMDETYGAMLIGVLLATFFQGMLTVQAYIYYESFPEDHRRLKLLVASVWFLDAIHLSLICQSAYHYLITSWGNNEALLISTPPLDLHIIFIAAPSLLCQAFFLYRIWTFSRHNYVLTGMLSAACLVVFGLGITISGEIVQVPSVAAFSHFTAQAVALFAIGAVVDVAIAFVLLVYLQQGRMQTQFDQTDFVIARIMQYTVATGLATSLIAVACLVVFLIAPHTFIFIAMHFSLGRLYTNALLATLNSRRALRHAAQTRGAASFAVMTSRIVTTVVDEVGAYPMSPRTSKGVSLVEGQRKDSTASSELPVPQAI